MVKHGYRGTPTYGSWINMRVRCNRKTASDYPRYGGRGIRVCSSWDKSFLNFLADMGERPEGCTLDRINVNGDYTPENCRWVTVKENCRNTRNSRTLTYNGKTQCLVEWSEDTGIPSGTISARIDRHGWPVEKALTVPVNAQHPGRTKHTRFLTYQGIKKTLKQWSREIGVPYPRLYYRVVYLKWSPDKALSTENF